MSFFEEEDEDEDDLNPEDLNREPESEGIEPVVLKYFSEFYNKTFPNEVPQFLHFHALNNDALARIFVGRTQNEKALYEEDWQKAYDELRTNDIPFYKHIYYEDDTAWDSILTSESRYYDWIVMTVKDTRMEAKERKLNRVSMEYGLTEGVYRRIGRSSFLRSQPY